MGPSGGHPGSVVVVGDNHCTVDRKSVICDQVGGKNLRHRWPGHEDKVGDMAESLYLGLRGWWLLQNFPVPNVDTRSAHDVPRRTKCASLYSSITVAVLFTTSTSRCIIQVRNLGAPIVVANVSGNRSDNSDHELVASY
jgi:hypothetical protein